MAKQEFVQLCHTYRPGKDRVAGWFMSEKLDGMRAVWDGGISRGMQCSLVPWANTEKHDRYVIKPLSTGLWTRYGQPIQAPGWFLDKLPDFPLDGELYMGIGKFQDTVSVVKNLNPGAGWVNIEYRVFDVPSYKMLLGDRAIGKKKISGGMDFLRNKLTLRREQCIEPKDFARTLDFLKCQGISTPVRLHNQERLPFTTDRAEEHINIVLDKCTEEEKEGIILRNGIYPWMPERVHHCLKHKAWSDAEAIVIGYTTGRETELGSKLLGLMGALIVKWEGRRFELSGFTEQERRFEDGAWAIDNPGQECPEWINNLNFPRGSKVTFRYGELSHDGIPLKARYWRKSE